MQPTRPSVTHPWFSVLRNYHWAIIAILLGSALAACGQTAPSLTSQPRNQTQPAGTNVTFSATATGTPVLYYQWFFNSNGIVNATNSSLVVTNVQNDSAGAYSVVVTNGFGIASSTNAILTVTSAPPFLVSQPIRTQGWPGAAVSLNVNAVGSLPLYFQWQLNGTPISNATNAVFTLNAPQLSDSGNYSVVVTNAFGSKTSSNALLTISQIVAWGAGMTNRFVLPDQGQSVIPSGVTNAVSVAGGGYHSMALRPDGRITAWGNDVDGQTGVPSTVTNAFGIGAGFYHSVALKSNGTVTAWGYNFYNQTTVPANATNVEAISAGWFHNLALKSNGTVVAWGAGTSVGSLPNYGQSIVPTNLSAVEAVAAGTYHSLALLSNGMVVAWGLGTSGQTNVPAGLSNVVAIAAGGSNSVALKNDGAVVAWGDNTYGQTNVPPGLSNVVAISAGAAQVMALKNDGTLVMWGDDTFGQTNVPSGLTNVTAIAAGAFHCLAIVNIGPVTFIAQPLNQTIYKGGEATFAVPFLGAPPTTPQWLQNGTNVIGGTNVSLVISNAQLTDSGAYQLAVSNSYGAVTSAVAVLTVNDTVPYFITQPTNLAVLRSSNAVFTPNVGGIAPISYQWLFDGAPIPGATNSTLTVSNVQLANDGYYSLAVTNVYGTNISAAAFLNVIDLAEALGPTNLVWVNSSPPSWFPETTNTHDGFAAAEVVINQGQQSTLQTTVTGPCAINFWWQTTGFLQMTFSIDGTNMVTDQFGNPWSSPQTFYVSSGAHVLKWTVPAQGGYPVQMAFLDQVVITFGPSLPILTTQPVSQTNAAGNGVSFTGSAVGTPPIGYQWYFNGGSISGATSSSFTLGNIQASNIGAYTLVATNAYGLATSSNAMLTVTPSAPVWTSQPTNTPGLTGGVAAFSGSTIGSSPIYYQWLFNGSPILNATNSLLTVSNVQQGNVGAYTLMASNAIGSALSSNATILIYTLADLATALDTPAITWSTTNVPWFPETNTTHDGVSAAQSGAISGSQESSLQGTVTGPATVTYWWQVSCNSGFVSLASSVGGAIQNSISGNIAWQQATNYVGEGSQTVEWDLYPIHGAIAGGTAWLDQVQVISGGTGPAITSNPSGVTTSAGNSASFSVIAIGTPPLLYQWQFGGTNIPGATNATLSLNNLQAVNAGIYTVAVSNDFGSTPSSNANLTVNPSAPVITLQPSSQSAVINGTASFTFGVIGSSPLNYQWQFDGTPIPGGSTSTLALTGLQPTNAGSYLAIVANNYGAVTSSIAKLEVNPTVVREFWGPSPVPFATPFGLSNVVAVACGDTHVAALRNDGTVTAWGQNLSGATNVPPDLTNVTALAAGRLYTVALKADGTVVTWGDNAFGEQFVPAGLSNVTAIATANFTILALRSDGTVVGWGRSTYGQTNIPSDLSNVVSIALGSYNGFAVKSDGTVVEWGNGPVWQTNGVNAQLIAGVGISNAIAVAAGGYSAWTLQYDGAVTEWGFGQSRFSNIVAVSASGSNPSQDDLIAVTDGGTLVTVGGIPNETPDVPNGLSNVVGVSTSFIHAAVLLNDGTPTVAQPLYNRTVHTADIVVFSSGTVGAAPLGFQWQYNGTNLPGATNGYLVLTNVPFSAAGTYTCVAGNGLGVVTNSSTLTILRSTPQFNSSGTLSSAGFAGEIDHLSGHGDVIVFASPDLINWVPILTNAPVTGSIPFLDPGATSQSRFYRAVEQ